LESRSNLTYPIFEISCKWMMVLVVVVVVVVIDEDDDEFKAAPWMER
jgi:hypothetical protein